MYEERFYRSWAASENLVSFRVIEKETDLLIMANRNLLKEASLVVRQYRHDVEEYIRMYPVFKNTLSPVKLLGNEPPIVKEMIEATSVAGVGPMASIAGAVADFTGRALLKFSDEIIVENGGDIFINTKKERLLAIYAGKSVFSGKIAVKIKPENTPLGVCTSSATVGPSLSLGNTDATVIISKTAVLSDAFATTVGNMVKSKADLEKAIDFVKKEQHIIGALVIIGDKMAMTGDVEIVKI